MLRDNEFSAEALNDILQALPVSAPGPRVLSLAYNPGSADCDRNIATEKGWLVRD